MAATWDGSIRYSENGTAMLVPYAMPRSVDSRGDTQDQGRYCIAYSRDGWFLLDSEEMLVLRWCASEIEAINARQALFVCS